MSAPAKTTNTDETKETKPTTPIAGYRVHTATPFKYAEGKPNAKSGDIVDIGVREAQRITSLRLGIVLVAVDKDGKAVSEDRQPTQPPPPPVEVQ